MQELAEVTMTEASTQHLTHAIGATTTSYAVLAQIVRMQKALPARSHTKLTASFALSQGHV